MSVNQTCENIVRLVNLSKLDYQLNQTPYILHFSIRKKFLRGHIPDLHSSPEISKDAQILHVKQEYQELYNLYQISTSSESNLRSEILALQSELILAKESSDEKEEQNESLRKSIVDIKIKYDEKCLELKPLKKENKVKKKQSKTKSVKNESNLHNEKTRSVKSESMMETVFNNNESKVTPNVPVSNGYDILDDNDFHPSLSRILPSSDFEVSTNTFNQISSSAILPSSSMFLDTTCTEAKTKLSKLLNKFSKTLDETSEMMKLSNFYKLGNQAKDELINK
jgi:hypothetical protein